eukprot:scaffold1350_cov249-Pinguiococcus_pyrenoidosus.AAC.5
MPITPKYTWSESASEVVVSVPLRGAKAADVDVFAADVFLKINFKPYLLALDLHGEVDDIQCRASATGGTLSVRLPKTTHGKWGRLTFDGDAKGRRAESLKRKQEQEEQLREKRRDRRIQDERTALRQMMSIEETERRAIEDLKEDEKQRAEEDMYATFERLRAEKAKVVVDRKPSRDAEDGNGHDGDLADEGIEDEIDDDELVQELLDEESHVSQDQRPSEMPMAASKEAEEPDETEEPEDDVLAYVPGPRASAGKVRISHTPRVFPTPLRESKRQEEDEWVQKNKLYLRKHPTMGKRLGKDAHDIGDVDPVWLKGKGDDLYRGGDLNSAMNAYQSALDADPDHLPCMSCKAMCLLRLGRLSECVNVCTELVEKLSKAVEEDARLASALKDAVSGDAAADMPLARLENVEPKLRDMLVETFVKRSAAFSQQGTFESAARDLKIALRLQADGDSESLRSSLNQLQKLEAAVRLKTDADALFASSEFEAADAEYEKALAEEPGLVSALSNRAALKMARGKHSDGAALCSRALDLLMADAGSIGHGEPEAHELISGAVPPPGSAVRKEWVLKTLLRRGRFRPAQLARTQWPHPRGLALSRCRFLRAGGLQVLAGGLPRRPAA